MAEASGVVVGVPVGESPVVDAVVVADVEVASVATVMRMERRAPVPRTSDFLITSHKTTDTDH